MLVEVNISSFDGLCTLSVFVPRQKQVVKTLEAAYNKLASVAKLSFKFREAAYIYDCHLYMIDDSGYTHKIR